MSSRRDEELVKAFIEGESAAFQILFERYYKKVYNLSLRFCNLDQILAEEAAQESFLQVYKSLPRFQFKSSFYTWLYRVTFNTCSILIKKDSRLKKRPLEGLEDSSILAEHHGPGEILLKKEYNQMVALVMQELPEDHRQVMILGPVMGLSYQEISEIIGESVAVIKGRLFRARQNFKKKFENKFRPGNFSTAESTNQT